MGIYIQGMELPKEKKITLTLFPDGRVYENHGERLWGNGKDCIPWKAVPVQPHGDLIDRTEAIVDANERAYDFWSSNVEADAAVKFLQEQVSIIPAEEAQP